MSHQKCISNHLIEYFNTEGQFTGVLFFLLSPHIANLSLQNVKHDRDSLQ